jgi:serine/threonine protein kinase
MIGQVLDGKYEVTGLIGRGGFGSVYQASDLKLKREVAVKVLKEREDQEQFKARFLREAESLARLNHPHIVTVHDYGEQEGSPFLVMELIEGVPLSDLAERQPLGLNHIRTIALQICDAMAYAHDQGIVHRDLTLKNIMRVGTSRTAMRVKILDFGLAKLIGSGKRTSDATMQGTPSYMSPEQILGSEIDARTDIFSYGVGLYRLLNDRFPFEAEHPTALLYLLVHEPTPAFAEGVPDELQALVRRCLEKSPDQRPGSFRELAGALEALQLPRAGEFDTTTVIRDSAAVQVITGPVRRLSNPYLNRVMIKNPDDFFGRDREIRKIYSRLDAPHPQSISIVGDRRIGKSSLLNFIYHRRNRRQFMQNAASAIFVYLDFQTRVDFDVPKFVGFLLSVLSYDNTSLGTRPGAEPSLDQLQEVVQYVHERGKRIIILMDEFEVITRNERFGASFFSFLRSLANSYLVAYVTSSRNDLQLMCHNQDISDSPFFNIFSNLPLRPLRPPEALALVGEPSAREGVPLKPHAEQLIELAGRFPMFLQIACSGAFEQLADDPDAAPDWAEIATTFAEEVRPHYTFLWESLEANEREVLTCIVGGKPVDRKHGFVVEKLVRRGYLNEEEGSQTVFCRSFGDFVLGHMGRDARQRSLLGLVWGKLRGKEI